MKTKLAKKKKFSKKVWGLVSDHHFMPDLFWTKEWAKMGREKKTWPKEYRVRRFILKEI